MLLLYHILFSLENKKERVYHGSVNVSPSTRRHHKIGDWKLVIHLTFSFFSSVGDGPDTFAREREEDGTGSVGSPPVKGTIVSLLT